MSNISINSILQASKAIIINPSKSLKNFGIDDFLFYTNPTLLLGKRVFDFIQNKKKERLEKERMYQEIIAEHQAAIKKQQEINSHPLKRAHLRDIVMKQYPADILNK